MWESPYTLYIINKKWKRCQFHKQASIAFKKIFNSSYILFFMIMFATLTPALGPAHESSSLSTASERTAFRIKKRQANPNPSLGFHRTVMDEAFSRRYLHNNQSVCLPLISSTPFLWIITKISTLYKATSRDQGTVCLDNSIYSFYWLITKFWSSRKRILQDNIPFLTIGRLWHTSISDGSTYLRWLVGMVLHLGMPCIRDLQTLAMVWIQSSIILSIIWKPMQTPDDTSNAAQLLPSLHQMPVAYNTTVRPQPERMSHQLSNIRLAAPSNHVK